MTYSNVVGKTESRHGDKWGEVASRHRARCEDE
jgi:hypothetical protein